MSEAIQAAAASEPIVSQEPIIESEATTEETSEVQAAEGEAKAPSAELKKEAKEAVVAMKKKFNLKVDGKEVEKEIDLANEAELVKILQMAEMANKRASEAAELRKSEMQRNQDLEGFLQMLKENPKSILEYMGHDIKGFAEKVLEEEIEKMKMSPEQKQIAELQKQLEAKEKAEAQSKQEMERQQMEAMRAKYAAEYEKDLMEALDTGSLPRNPEVVHRMTNYMRIALQNGIQLSFKDIIPLVKDKLNKDLQSLLRSQKIDEIESLLGDDVVSNLYKKVHSKKVTAKKAPPSPSQIKDTAPSADKKPEVAAPKISVKDFFKNL